MRVIEKRELIMPFVGPSFSNGGFNLQALKFAIESDEEQIYGLDQDNDGIVTKEEVEEFVQFIEEETLNADGENWIESMIALHGDGLTNGELPDFYLNLVNTYYFAKELLEENNFDTIAGADGEQGISGNDINQLIGLGGTDETLDIDDLNTYIEQNPDPNIFTVAETQGFMESIFNNERINLEDIETKLETATESRDIQFLEFLKNNYAKLSWSSMGELGSITPQGLLKLIAKDGDVSTISQTDIDNTSYDSSIDNRDTSLNAIQDLFSAFETAHPEMPVNQGNLFNFLTSLTDENGDLTDPSNQSVYNAGETILKGYDTLIANTPNAEGVSQQSIEYILQLDDSESLTKSDIDLLSDLIANGPDSVFTTSEIEELFGQLGLEEVTGEENIIAALEAYKTSPDAMHRGIQLATLLTDLIQNNNLLSATASGDGDTLTVEMLIELAGLSPEINILDTDDINAIQTFLPDEIQTFMNTLFPEQPVNKAGIESTLEGLDPETQSREIVFTKFLLENYDAIAWSRSGSLGQIDTQTVLNLIPEDGDYLTLKQADVDGVNYPLAIENRDVSQVAIDALFEAYEAAHPGEPITAENLQNYLQSIVDPFGNVEPPASQSIYDAGEFLLYQFDNLTTNTPNTTGITQETIQDIINLDGKNSLTIADITELNTLLESYDSQSFSIEEVTEIYSELGLEDLTSEAAIKAQLEEFLTSSNATVREIQLAEFLLDGINNNGLLWATADSDGNTLSLEMLLEVATLDETTESLSNNDLEAIAPQLDDGEFTTEEVSSIMNTLFNDSPVDLETIDNKLAELNASPETNAREIELLTILQDHYETIAWSGTGSLGEITTQTLLNLAALDSNDGILSLSGDIETSTYSNEISSRNIQDTNIEALWSSMELFPGSSFIDTEIKAHLESLLENAPSLSDVSNLEVYQTGEFFLKHYDELNALYPNSDGFPFQKIWNFARNMEGLKLSTVQNFLNTDSNMFTTDELKYLLDTPNEELYNLRFESGEEEILNFLNYTINENAGVTVKGIQLAQLLKVGIENHNLLNGTSISDGKTLTLEMILEAATLSGSDSELTIEDFEAINPTPILDNLHFSEEEINKLYSDHPSLNTTNTREELVSILTDVISNDDSERNRQSAQFLLSNLNDLTYAGDFSYGNTLRKNSLLSIIGDDNTLGVEDLNNIFEPLDVNAVIPYNTPVYEFLRTVAVFSDDVETELDDITREQILNIVQPPPGGVNPGTNPGTRKAAQYLLRYFDDISENGQTINWQQILNTASTDDNDEKLTTSDVTPFSGADFQFSLNTGQTTNNNIFQEINGGQAPAESQNFSFLDVWEFITTNVGGTYDRLGEFLIKFFGQAEYAGDDEAGISMTDIQAIIDTDTTFGSNLLSIEDVG